MRYAYQMMMMMMMMIALCVFFATWHERRRTVSAIMFGREVRKLTRMSYRR